MVVGFCVCVCWGGEWLWVPRVWVVKVGPLDDPGAANCGQGWGGWVECGWVGASLRVWDLEAAGLLQYPRPKRQAHQCSACTAVWAVLG